MRFERDPRGVGEPPIVLLHGLGSTRRIFDLLVPHLAARHKVLAYDQRGHGESERPEHGYTVAQSADDLEEVLRQEGASRPVLVGHSFGANVAIRHALTRRTARGVVLVDGGIVEMHEHLSWEAAAVRLAPPEDDPQAIARFIRDGAGRSDATPAHAEIRRSLFERAPGGSTRKRLTRERHLALLRSAWEQDVRDEIRRLACPTLVIVCRLPQAAVPQQRWLAQKERAARRLEALPHVSVRWFDDTGHDIPLERPRELAECILGFAASLR